MLYTLGHKESYERYFKEQGCPQKRGCGSLEDGSFCEGGTVWRTKEDAAKHLADDFALYGVIADWEKDTYDAPSGFRALLVSSLLVKLE